MNKNKLVNNQYRKQEFNKRRKFGKAESLCTANGNCPIFQNCLLEIDQLTNNWNELRKFIESERFDKQYAFDEYYLPIIDKMEELKEKK